MTLSGTASFVPWLIALMAVLAFVGLAFGLAYFFTLKCFHYIFDRPYPRPMYDRSPTEINQDTIFGRGQNWFYSNRLDFQDLSVKSYDGIRLIGYYRPAEKRDSKNLVILLHGWKDYPSVMGAFAQMYLEMDDCHILIPHMRAHGMSRGRYVGYGLADSQDLLTWIKYMDRRLGGHLSIVCHGWSMGAATALIAAGSRRMPASVKGIIADSPYSSLEEQLRHTIHRRYHFSPAMLISLIGRFAKKNLGYSVRQVSPKAYAANIRIPVLLIHGTADQFVLPSMSEELFDIIRAPKRLLFVQDAGHVMSYDAAPSSYSSEVEQLLRASGYLKTSED